MTHGQPPEENHFYYWVTMSNDHYESHAGH